MWGTGHEPFDQSNPTQWVHKMRFAAACSEGAHLPPHTPPQPCISRISALGHYKIHGCTQSALASNVETALPCTVCRALTYSIPSLCLDMQCNECTRSKTCAASGCLAREKRNAVSLRQKREHSSRWRSSGGRQHHRQCGWQ